MIIIKTTGGDVLINEKAIQRISHDREKQEVMVFALDGGVTSPNIKNVEEVFYANDMQAIEHRDKGSKVEKLEAECKEMYDFGLKMRTALLETQSERDELKEKLTNLENRIKTAGELKSDQKSPLTLRAISPMLGDCTQTFVVDGCDKMTVYDFTMDVVRRNQYVDLDFKRDDLYIWRVHYNEQRAHPIDMEKKPEGIEKMLVKSALCNGGYDQMNYEVTLYDQEK